MLDAVEAFWTGLDRRPRRGRLMKVVDGPRHLQIGTGASVRLGGIDHLEWWVGNARSFAAFLCSNFGFTPGGLRRTRNGPGRPGLLPGSTRVDIRFMISGAPSS